MEYDATSTAYHHISDANVYSIGSFNFPLPCILYSKGQGWDIFSSKKFDFEFYGHGEGHKAYKRYVLDEGQVKHITDASFPEGEVELDGYLHEITSVDGKNVNNVYACYSGKHYLLESQSTADFGLFGGSITSFYDFSITKNVLSMMLIFLLLSWAFFSIAKAYRNRGSMAPKGLQSFIEPIFMFIQDEVAKPFLGPKWEKFLPLLCSLFFFILALNLFGQIPFLGGSNVTGNLAVTLVLALSAYFIVIINGNKHYWGHIFWMPGVPAIIKILILTPVEILGIFIKPFTLMLRLFANIVAGHIVVLSFVGLIFVFGKMGQSMGGVAGGLLVSIPLTMFIMAIELLVAFIQAYVFTLLVASYIGAATEEQHAENH
jgi:F-type H+-transporting ATPase subunit a